MAVRFSLSKRQSAVLHYFLSGFGVAIAAALTGVASSGLVTVGTLRNAVAIAVIVAVADTIRFLSPSPGAPGTTPAAPTT